MTTLTTGVLPELLDRLFAEASASQAELQQRLAAMDRGALGSQMTSATDYRAFYEQMKDMPLAVSRDTATLLYMLARSTRARTVVEFGTSFGISTLHLAAALRDNGSGRVITTEFEASKVTRARQHLAAGGLADLVEVRDGDALETLSRDLPESIDLVLLDGAKGLYPAVLGLVEDRLRIGGIVIADNADWAPDYLSRVRSADNGYLSVPLSDDIEMSVKVGSAGIAGAAA